MMCHFLTPAHRWVQELAVSLAILLHCWGPLLPAHFWPDFIFLMLFIFVVHVFSVKLQKELGLLDSY